MTLRKTYLAAALALASSSALAANTTELKLTGVIVPYSCDITLPDGDTLDLGSADADALKTDQFSAPFPDKSFSVKVDCGGASKISVNLKDNKATSLLTNTDSYNFGLGFADAANTQKIGGLALLQPAGAKITVDGAEKTSVMSSDGLTWTAAADQKLGASARLGVSADSSNYSLLSGTNYIFPMKLQALINRKDALPWTNDFKLDGSVTLEVQYY